MLDCISLATGVLCDAIICMTSDAALVDAQVLQALVREEADVEAVRYEISLMQVFFIFDRELLYADIEVVAPQLEMELDLARTATGACRAVQTVSDAQCGLICYL